MTQAATHDRPLPPGVLRAVVSNCAVAAMYFGSAHFGLLLSFEHTNATAVWPPSGIALAALVLFGPRVWPGILFGATAANFAYFAALPAVGEFAGLGGALITGAGNTLEAMAAWALLGRFVGTSHPFDDVRSAFRFGAMAAATAVIGATVGMLALLSVDVANWGLVGTGWVTWWLGDASGILVYTPLLLSWTIRSGIRWTWLRISEALVLGVTFLPAGFVLFGGWIAEHYTYSLPYLVMPLLLWVVFRFGLREASTAVALVSVVAIWGTVRGHGPFLSETLNESLVLVQFFTATVSVTVLALSAAVSERRRLLDELTLVNRTLEDRISERTSQLASINEELTAEVAERRKAEELIKHLANHDALTGLANRRLFEELFQSVEALARRRGHQMAVLFLDLDDFKPINDEFGHNSGDDVLRKISERLLVTVRESDVVARFGGDEFVILLPELKRIEAAERVAAKLIQAVREPVLVRGQPRTLGVSVGVAIYPHDGRDVASLVRSADHAMYVAKSGGKNQYARFAEESWGRAAMESAPRLSKPGSAR